MAVPQYWTLGGRPRGEAGGEKRRAGMRGDRCEISQVRVNMTRLDRGTLKSADLLVVIVQTLSVYWWKHPRRPPPSN